MGMPVGGIQGGYVNIQENIYGPLAANVELASLSDAWLQMSVYFSSYAHFQGAKNISVKAFLAILAKLQGCFDRNVWGPWSLPGSGI